MHPPSFSDVVVAASIAVTGAIRLAMVIAPVARITSRRRSLFSSPLIMACLLLNQFIFELALRRVYPDTEYLVNRASVLQVFRVSSFSK
jgi:hypothetical protein